MKCFSLSLFHLVLSVYTLAHKGIEKKKKREKEEFVAFCYSESTVCLVGQLGRVTRTTVTVVY